MSPSAPSPALLRRASWKAEAIRRGNLKISGPIPITEDMPLNDEEEKRFAENGTLSDPPQLPVAPLEEQRQQSATPPRPAHPAPAVPDHPMPLRSNLVADQPQQEEEPRDHAPLRSPRNLQPISIVQRDSMVPSSIAPSPSPFRSTPESAAAKATQRKRKSGLRNVFRKMFGKKTAEPEHQQQQDETTRRGHSYHNSDPGLLRSTPPIEQRPTPSPVGPRISDLPVKELEPLHPLGQHLPYPMNVNAPPASPPDEYLTFDVNRPGRRRATLPNVPGLVVQRHSLDESRPKLAPWQERIEDGNMSPSRIGIALSSPSHGTSRPNKRRSRSADALRDMAKDLASTERRRSAEIKYWRESNMSGSVYSRPATARTVETFRSVQMQEPMIREPEAESYNEMSATLVQADDPQTPTSAGLDRSKEDEKEGDVYATVSDFNFGNLKNGRESGPVPAEPQPEPARHVEPVSQAGGQEISPVAPLPAPNPNRLSMEERLMHLENQYSNLETLTRRLSSRNNRQTIILENAPRSLRSRDRSTSVSASRSHSRSAPSIHQEPSHLRHQSTSSEYVEEPVHAPSSPTSTLPVASSNEQAKALKDMRAVLEVERNARIALEHRVHALQIEVSNLQALVNKLVAGSGATYPTPSPDMLIMTSEDKQRVSCSTPRAMAHNQSTYYSQHQRPHDWRHDSESMYSDDLVLESSGTGEAASPDEWATPKEEGFSNSGFFHTRDDGMKEYS
ncbi:hypothetical protein COCCADRAFT_36938 [Bipolaris zeicola 26-R-13]|uniref:Uncharacterized protein n=1 Tax=Cochliobolus carbonum (strain 26-R-13) TaxID=930089 RepID=W6Y761_COCC2|nr:uncharacterized protein COCCADRAFT_36938 [Bipolaris zeicola 26-R-13]EUC33270.1 hypothetical protein COCCADRAFT_36938 [Bipolaris zeicola 26-R-13]